MVIGLAHIGKSNTIASDNHEFFKNLIQTIPTPYSFSLNFAPDKNDNINTAELHFRWDKIKSMFLPSDEEKEDYSKLIILETKVSDINFSLESMFPVKKAWNTIKENVLPDYEKARYNLSMGTLNFLSRRYTSQGDVDPISINLSTSKEKPKFNAGLRLTLCEEEGEARIYRNLEGIFQKLKIEYNSN